MAEQRLQRVARNGALALLTIACAPPLDAQAGLAGFRQVAAADVPLDGQRVALPLPRNVRSGDLRFVLAGSVHCSYNGRTYTPVTATGAGEIDWAATYVAGLPQDMRLVGHDRSSQRYALRLARDESRPPETISAGVDVDRLVRELIITPTEVRESLSGRLRLEVWQATKLGPANFVLLGGVGLLLLLGAAIVRLRQGLGVGAADVSAILRRIDRKFGPAIRAIDDRRWDAGELRSQLRRLRNGARELARHISAFRRAAATVDRDTLDPEIGALQRRLEATERGEMQQELEATLTAKRQLRDLLSDTEAAEARYLLRLSKIESAIEATTLWLAGQEGRLADEAADAQAIAALNQELESLDRAIEEPRAVKRG